jgi:hypothetical protein
MFAKLAVIILSFGLLATTLLANRQQRIEAAKQLAEAQSRLTVHDETLWKLRTEIALRVSPRSVERLVARLAESHGGLEPLRIERFDELVQRELDARERANEEARLVELGLDLSKAKVGRSVATESREYRRGAGRE